MRFPMNTDATQEEPTRPFQQKRRLAILEATRTLCHRVGYETATMEMIAEEASVTKPTIYAYFPNKEELVAEAFADALESWACFLIQQMDEALPQHRFSVALRALLRAKFTPGGVALTFPSPPISAHPRFLAATERLVEICVSILRGAQMRGEANSDLDPEATVRAYLCFLADPTLEHQVHSGILPADLAIETLHTVLMNGLRARK